MAICSHFKCLPTEDRFRHLSFYQKIFLYDKIIKEKNDSMEMLKNCFEILKPWLDKEMYFSIKEKDENVHVNSDYGKTPIVGTAEDIDDGDGIIID